MKMVKEKETLWTMLDEKLFSEKYATFPSYCAENCRFSRLSV